VIRAHATIAVTAPAGIPKPEGVEAGVAVLRGWGYEVVLAPNLAAKHRYNAGTAETRAEDLNWALSAPGIDAVWLARGGYGCVHTLPSLPREGLDVRPVIGYSDATAVFAALEKTRGGPLVHGPLLDAFATKVDDATRERMRAMLAGEALPTIEGVHLAGPKGEVRGKVVGGNLSVLASLVGTPFSFDAAGAIVVLEDVMEAPYRIDRMLTQLRLSGALDGAVGFVLGEFVQCEPPKDATYALEEVLCDLLAPLGVPVWGRMAIGHGERNLAFRIGAEGSLGTNGLSQ